MSVNAPPDSWGRLATTFAFWYSKLISKSVVIEGWWRRSSS
jgi:hypothetical protein